MESRKAALQTFWPSRNSETQTAPGQAILQSEVTYL